ncbi:GNAT family protein [Brevibacterium samyangense]|uniref:GNAT family protein n=1 Tax=Brevibacterium samyangense TaxID=366888 RepID=A0ABN2T7I9_9MICO
MSRFWPVVLREGPLVLRPLERSDARAYAETRAHNARWLTPWEATNPDPRYRLPPFGELRRHLNAQAKRGQVLPFALEIDGRFRGQLTVSSFQWGSVMSATLGYWIDERVAGHGHMPTAVALATDHLVHTLGLHRVEVNIRPENTPSLRVVEKLGFRDEGLRARYMHIDGDWRDHRTFALTAEDIPHGLLPMWLHVRDAGPTIGGTRATDPGTAGPDTGRMHTDPDDSR